MRSELLRLRAALDDDVPPEEMDTFISQRIASVRKGESAPALLPVRDGRTIRSQCAVLPDDGRMLTYTDVTDFIRNAEELERLATTDSITLCYNRRHFVALAEAEWSRFQRYNRPLSVMMLDVDYFKSINDRYGHEAGDRTLARIADVCQSVKRSSDVVGRLGGDELAMLLPETDLVQAHVIADRLRSGVAPRRLRGQKHAPARERAFLLDTVLTSINCPSRGPLILFDGKLAV